MAKAGWMGVTLGFAVSAVASLENGGAFDSGGQRALSANYSMDSRVAGMVGAWTNANGSMTAQAGYIGQLTEVTQLVVRIAPKIVNEGASAQAGGVAALDDGTFSVLAGSNLVWVTPAFPIATLSPDGKATATAVWSNTTGFVTGRYFGVTGVGEVLVVDSDPDNYGIYGADGIPDGWQVRWFGTNNPLGVATATNSVGQANRYAYIADLDPTNPASVFRIVGLSNGVSESLVFFTSSANRRYMLESTTNLQGGGWEKLSGAMPEMGNGGVFVLRNSRLETPCFYRVQVVAP